MRDLDALQTFVLRVAADGELKRRYIPLPPHYDLKSQREADLGKIAAFAKGVTMSVAILKDYQVDPSDGVRADFIEVVCLRRFFFWWQVSWRSGIYQFRSAADLYWLIGSLDGYLSTLEATT